MNRFGFTLNYGHTLKNQAGLYNLHQPLYIHTEFGIAFGKNIGLNSFNPIRQLSKQLKTT